jgi:hypothetical protein
MNEMYWIGIIIIFIGIGMYAGMLLGRFMYKEK